MLSSPSCSASSLGCWSGWLLSRSFCSQDGSRRACIRPAARRGGAFLIPDRWIPGQRILLFRWFPNARGSGIPQTKFAIFINNGYISLKTVIGKFLCCSVSLASGIALGREGPSVQIGAGIASVLGRRFGLSPEDVKPLVPVGCSAALAAAFNTPIAAVLFSLEEILGDMHAPVLGTVVIESATSWMVLHLVLGDQPLFHVPSYQLVHPLEFGIYAILGVVGGLGIGRVREAVAVHTRAIQEASEIDGVAAARGRRTVGRLAGLVHARGIGSRLRLRRPVLGGDFPWKTVAALAVLKLIATPVCYGSGNAGGIFGPSLFIGAMIGGSVGIWRIGCCRDTPRIQARTR